MFKEKINQINYYGPKEKKPAEFEPVTQEIIEKIEEIKIKGKIIGTGKTAEVYIAKSDPSVCYKIIVDKERYFNSVESEAQFLNETCGMYKDVEIPMPYYSIIAENDMDVLVMKTLDAISIEDLIRKDLDAPANFNFAEFFSKLENFFEELNNKNIFHLEAHAGNIMINMKTGNPCVIDFGAAEKNYLTPENPYVRKIGGKEFIFTIDEERIKEVKAQLKRHLIQKIQKATESANAV